MTAMAVLDETDEFRHSIRSFVSGQIAPLLDEAEALGEMTPALLSRMKEQGYTGLRVPTEWGGQGLSFSQYCTVLEEFGRLSPALHFWLIDSLGMTLSRIGTASQKEKYLRGYAKGNLQGALAFSEPEAGSDAAAIRTKATKKDGGWVINGRKHYTSRGDTADFVFVTAVTDSEKRARGGITTFVVDRGTPGFSVSRVDVSMGSRLHKLAELNFDDCFVPHDSVIGEVGQGFAAAMSTLDDGRLCVASTCLGVATTLIDLMVEHTKSRKTFGTPLADRQGIRWMIADSALELALGQALVRQSIERHERKEALGAAASMCKLHCTEMVNRIADRAVQVFGGMGVVRGVRVEQLYRDVRFFRIGEGASEIQRMLIARSLLGRPGRDGD